MPPSKAACQFSSAQSPAYELQGECGACSLSLSLSALGSAIRFSKATCKASTSASTMLKAAEANCMSAGDLLCRAERLTGAVVEKC